MAATGTVDVAALKTSAEEGDVDAKLAFGKLLLS